MSEIEFEGKIYKDIDLSAQKVLSAVNTYTFRYFPKDRVWMASDYTARHFQIDKFYKIIDETSGPGVIFKNDHEKDMALYTSVITGKEEVASDRLRSADGESWYKVTLAAISRDAEGRIETVGGIIQDYDTKMMTAGVVQLLAEDYYTVISVDFEKDEVTPYRMLNVIEEHYGEQLAHKPGYREMFDQYIDGEVLEEERAEMKAITAYENVARELSRRKAFIHDFRILRDGKPVYIRVKFVKMNDDEKLTRGVVGFTNVTKDKVKDYQKMAFFDSITLGSNFNYYSEKLKDARRKGFIVSMDIRAFKMVNDVCGIEKGDQVLRAASKIVENRIGSLGFYGHVNADHFVFYLGTEQENDVITVMNGITDDFRSLVTRFDIPRISPYFGVTVWEPGDRIQVMFSEANTAKHKIKNRKDVNFGFYREEDNKVLIEAKKVEDAFDDAIACRQFEMWYQPKYDPVDGKLTGAEALVRWRKNGEIIPPAKFIPVYEKNGMIRQLDSYVFEAVCRQQKAWQDELGHIVPISINLSRASMYYDSTLTEYKKMAENIGVSTKMLPIEITESAAVGNDGILVLAEKFYEAGFPLCIDDFGTGYSSLSMLNRMRFDTLKLDKSLTDYIGEYKGDSLIKHTIALAKDLGLTVTAEGVEKEDQVEFLKKVDCDTIQGYYFDRPMPAKEFEEKLKKAI